MRKARNGREYEAFYGDPSTLAPGGWKRVSQEEALAQPPHIDVMYVDRDQAGPSFWVMREKSDLTRLLAEAKQASNYLHHIDMTWDDTEIRAGATVCGHRLYRLIVDIEDKARERGGTVEVELGSSRVGTWFAALSAGDRTIVLALLDELRSLCEKRTEGADDSMRQLDLTLGLLHTLNADHQAAKPKVPTTP
jgi:hypothetical protein